MKSYVLVLEPEIKLFNKISNIKKECFDLVGHQLYLEDPPHTTLLVGNFKDFNQWQEALSDFVNNLRQREYDLSFEIKEWEIFQGDKITKKDTLTCSLIEPSGQLQALEEKIVYFMIQFREKELIRRYQKANASLNEEAQNNLNKYGFPYVGKFWKPHIGIASFNQKSFKVIWNKYKQKCPQGIFRFTKLVIYELDQDTEKLKLVTKYNL